MHYSTDKENELVLPTFFYLYMEHPFHVHLLHIYFEKLSPLTPSFCVDWSLFVSTECSEMNVVVLWHGEMTVVRLTWSDTGWGVRLVQWYIVWQDECSQISVVSGECGQMQGSGG